MPPSLSNAVAKRKAEFLAGRVCAQHALQEIGLNTEVAIGTNRQPLWPKNIVGSISHSNNTALAAIARKGKLSGLGIDVEHIVDIDTAESMVGQIINDEELKFIQKNNQLDCLMLTMIFSAKESFFKAVYPTIQKFIDFDTISLCAVTDHSLTFKINCQLSNTFTKHKLIEISFVHLNENEICTFCAL